MKVYFVSVIRWELVEGELIENTNETKPLKKIVTKNGNRFVPPTTKLWTNKTEMIVCEFANHFNKMAIDDFLNRYNLSKEEAKVYLKLAKDKYPEKFI